MFNKASALTLAVAVSVLLVGQVLGHGMMMDPPNRSSLWRFDPTAPPNYDDDGLFCGGLSVQWDQFGGKCGVCGDQYDDAHPQANENTGTYGQGKVVATYEAGSIIDITINLTTNHKGYFNFSLCELVDPNAPESGEDCFKPLKLGDGSDQYKVEPQEKVIKTTVKLTEGFTCDRCVLRWNYRAGNNWGDCGDGTYGDGCGPQETFRSCSDIAIS